VITSYAIGADGRLTQTSTILTSGEISYNLYVHASVKYIYGKQPLSEIFSDFRSPLRDSLLPFRSTQEHRTRYFADA